MSLVPGTTLGVYEIRASIGAGGMGEVYRARDPRLARAVAVKVQYPNIADSIDSDVDNVATLLRLINLVPQGVDFAPVLAEAKQQLHAEADYHQEAAALAGFARLLEDDTRFVVPAVIEELTSSDVLAMAYLDGQPIESVADAPAALRNQVAGTLLELAMREVFEWGLVQTDPNFANYRYDAQTGSVGLLDFGAVREPVLDQVSPGRVGRAEDADIKLTQPSVSRRHAEITVTGSQVMVKDLGSHNGTTLNGTKVAAPVELKFGDVLEVANVSFRLEGPAGMGMTIFNESQTLVPSAELTWEEIRAQRQHLLRQLLGAVHAHLLGGAHEHVHQRLQLLLGLEAVPERGVRVLLLHLLIRQ